MALNGEKQIRGIRLVTLSLYSTRDTVPLLAAEKHSFPLSVLWWRGLLQRGPILVLRADPLRVRGGQRGCQPPRPRGAGQQPLPSLTTPTPGTWPPIFPTPDNSTLLISEKK